MSKFFNLPVNINGSGPLPGSGSGSGNTNYPTDASSYEFTNQFYDAIEQKMQYLNCGAEYPTPSDYFATGTIDSFTTGSTTITGSSSSSSYSGSHSSSSSGSGSYSYDIETLNFHFSNVGDWSPGEGCTGQRWAGRDCGECLGYIPKENDLIVITNYGDAWTWVRLPISSNTYDSDSNTGTITTTAIPALNAVTANFWSSLNDINGAQYRIVKRGDGVSGSGMTSRDRRPLKPNSRDYWRGVVSTGVDDGNGNGSINEVTNQYNPNPYNQANPTVQWPIDHFKGDEVRYFDGTGKLQKQTIIGNNFNTLGFGHQSYKITVTATTGTFSLFANGGSCSPNWDATSSAIETALESITGLSGNVTVSGAGPFEITFNAAFGFVLLDAADATVSAPDNTNGISGDYIICSASDKGMPGRIPSPMLLWYGGTREPFVTHMPDDSQGTVGKPSYNKNWNEGDICTVSGCISVAHATFDVDAKYEDDNNCEAGSAGDWVAPGFHRCFRQLQLTGLGLLGSFIDIWNPWGNFDHSLGPNYFTPATWANGAQGAYSIDLHAWTSSLSVGSGGAGSVGIAPFDVPAYPLNVFYTLQNADGRNVGSGTTSLDAYGGVGDGWSSDDDGFTIYLWPGNTRSYRRRHKYIYGKMQWTPDCGIDPVSGEPGCNDPPAITAGGHLDNPAAPTLAISQGGTLDYNTTYYYVVTALNASGETMASPEASIVTKQPSETGNTYSITISWTPELGAVSYNVYGRNSGSEQLLANVDAYSGSWIDDGSVTPTTSLPTSNTTSTDCFGTGVYICRDISQGHLGVTTDGFVNDGASPLVTGVLSRYDGDVAGDAFSGRGAITIANDDASYFDRLFRGTFALALQKQRDAENKGAFTYSNKYSIFDASVNWWTDGLNEGLLRTQAGTFTGGGTTTLTDSTYYDVGTSKNCWFSSGRYAGGFNGTTATPFSYFIIEIYAGGIPAGWTVADDGSAQYSAPTPTGNTGTIALGSPPSISGMTPGLIHGIGFVQPLFIQGDNFQSGCVVTLTGPSSQVISSVPVSLTAGEINLSVLFPIDSYGAWTAVVKNADGRTSSTFDFNVNQMQAAPVQSFAGGTFTLAATLATAATSSSGYLIHEGRYEQSRWAGRVCEFSNGSTKTQLVCRYSNNNWAFFDEQSSPIDGAYEFKEIMPGAVLLLSETQPTVASGLLWCEAPPDGSTKRFWTQPTGSDTRKSGVTFRSRINDNNETKANDFGVAGYLDDFSYTIPDELYYLLGSLHTISLSSIDWHNYDSSMTPQNNFNGREGGAGDDLDFARSSEIWTANYPPPELVSPCTGVAAGEANSYFLDGSQLDNTAPYGDATSSVATGGYVDCAANYSCCDQPSPLPLYNVTVDGSWIFAYPWLSNVPTCFSSTATLYCYSPPVADGDWDVAAPCACHCVDCYSCANPPDTDANGDGCIGDCLGDYADNGCVSNTTHVHKDGEDLWIGGSVGLKYDGWALMDTMTGTDATRVGDKIGYEPTPIDPASILGDPNYIGDVSTSYAITNWVALIELDGDYNL